MGYQVAQGLRQGVDAFRAAARQTGEMMVSYLRDESPSLVRVIELDAFRDAVDQLNRQVEEMESRLSDLGDEAS
jgi:ubiquinone biosynthesis protein UbiJ